MSGIIKDVSFVLPQNSYSNDDLIKKYNLDSTSQWVEKTTGFKRRHFVKDAQEFEDIILQAAKNVSCKNIDGIIVASSTNFYKFPGLSQIVHKGLGCGVNMRTLDINAACNGFLQAMIIANYWLNDGCKRVIVIGADAMSSILNFEDRSTCFLFGDAAGAVLLEQSDEKGIQNHITLTNSKSYEKLIAKEYVEMNGRYVFEESIKYFDAVIDEVLKKSGLNFKDIDHFILHQANYRILNYFAKKRGLDEVKVPFLAQNFGNVSAASIPAALSQIVYKNKKIVLAGFGAGFTASAIVLS